MNYSKQMKKAKRKQLKLAAEQQKQQRCSAYSCAKPGKSSKTMMAFIIVCGFIANTMSAKADAAPVTAQMDTPVHVADSNVIARQ